MSIKSCSVKLVCLTALLCLSVSPVALFYVCVTFIRSYVTTSQYVPTTCHITDTNVTSSNITCQCENATGSCESHDACVRLTVRYDMPVLSEEMALLYETHSQKKELTRDKNTTCSYYICLNTSRDITADADVIGYDIIHPGHDVVTVRESENFTCFIDPDDADHALRTVPQKRDVIMALLGPLSGILLGIGFCIIAKVCTREKD